MNDRDEKILNTTMLLVSAALSYAASDTYFTVITGDNHEADEMDLKWDMLKKAIDEAYLTLHSENENDDSEPDSEPARTEMVK